MDGGATIALAGASAAMAGVAAHQQNQAIKSSMATGGRAARAEAKAASSQAAEQIRIRQQETERRIGAFRTIAAANGVAGGSLNTAIAGEAGASAGDIAATEENNRNVFAAIKARRENESIQLQSQKLNPAFAFFEGGLRGLSTGIALRRLGAELAATDETRTVWERDYAGESMDDDFIGPRSPFARNT
jgi:hypothetical protein